MHHPLSVQQWFPAFLLTCVSESALIYGIARFIHVNPWLAVLCCVLGNLVSHPIQWFLLPYVLGDLGYWVYVIFGEVWVMAIEVMILVLGIRALTMKQAMIVSLAINLFSIGTSLLLQHLGIRFF